MASELTPDEVFVIRMWAEPSDAPRADHWRARISVLNSGKELHADGVEQAVEVISSVLRKADAKRR